MELLYQYKGLIGCNLPCDLHMEHLNRRLEKIVRSIGANVTPEAIVKAEKWNTYANCLKSKHLTLQYIIVI